jgi:NADH:ubiquinone oxidoreductase subunit 3 (subunit A)
MNTLTFYFLFIPVLAVVLLIVNQFTAVNKPDVQKVSPYECGFQPLGSPRDKFSVQFFLVAILFVVFDLEVILLYPFAVTLSQISIYGFWVYIIFIGLLTLGFIYEFAKGALKFHKSF